MRRLITRLLSVIPVIICVLFTSGDSPLQQHIALNNLMNDSQVFLAFALPFSMLPLLMLTNSEKEMGSRFKNSYWVKIFGWISVIGLTFLNIIGLPDQIADFYGDSPTHTQIVEANWISGILIILILLLLMWTLIELHNGQKEN